MGTRWAYLNGDWVDDQRLSIPVSDLGFLMGVTATERLRTFGGKVFRLAEHLDRMRGSLTIIGLDSKSITQELGAAIEEFLQRNRPLFLAGDDWAIVAFATPGAGQGGATTCVHGFPLRFSDWSHQYEEGVSLYLSDHRQTPANCWPPELKCRSRMHYYLADQQARAIEPGARAVLLDQDGFLGEASTANLVLYKNGEGALSPKMEKVLPGVSVAVVRELCQVLGLAFVERDLTTEELLSADEVWLCSTSICLLPVTQCEGAPVGSGAPGPIYRRVLSEWNKLVGLDIAQQARAMSEGT